MCRVAETTLKYQGHSGLSRAPVSGPHPATFLPPTGQRSPLQRADITPSQSRRDASGLQSQGTASPSKRSAFLTSPPVALGGGAEAGVKAPLEGVLHFSTGFGGLLG